MRIQYHALMSDSLTRTPSPPVVATAAWLLPGAGYWILGQRARALTVGISIITLYVAGLLIGGVRLIEVPGYGDHGEQLIVSQRTGHDRQQNSLVIEQVTEDKAIPDDAKAIGWVLKVHPLDEIRNKPWYLAQVLNGPMNLVASWGSIRASQPSSSGQPFTGFRSHSRTNELGVLYTAVAGMLNLLAIIDSASRAGYIGENE
jgi:hypothetical protein